VRRATTRHATIVLVTDATRILIGGYTTAGGGIVGVGFDGARFTPPRVVAAAENPSWITRDGHGGLLAVSEVEAGAVVAFASDGDGFAPVGELDARGSYPAHIGVDPTGEHAVVTTWGGGTVTLLVRRDGRWTPGATVGHTDPSRVVPGQQDVPHPHQAVLHAGEWLVPDLGLDAVVRYRVDGDRLVEVGRLALPAGSGPRHLVVDVVRDRVLVAGELDCSVTVVALADGTVLDHVPTVPGGAPSGSTASGIRWVDEGAVLVVATRGVDEVATFAVDDAGRLSEVDRHPSGGAVPRDLVVHDDVLLVADQGADAVVALALDRAGRFGGEIARVATPAPTCLLVG
jgi:6-phosphogluconolactonase